jgi:hypothetical protein
MNTLIRILTFALMLGFSAVRGAAPEAPALEPTPESEPAKQWVWLAKQGVWGYGYEIKEGPASGLWRIDPGSKRAPAPAPAPAAADPYGFAAVLNRIRASMGLRPAAYDPSLSSWAAQNNVVQSNRGLGHHVNPGSYQNCGWNYADAESVAMGWMNSPGHRQNMLQPNMSRFGIAFGPGPYWTMNAM